MEVTIDEARNMLMIIENSTESLKTAIEIMRKYQKIKDILNSAGYIENGTLYSYTYDEDSRVKHIREVVEDGQNIIKD